DIKETYNESQTQLIFVKDNKVVCSIWGYGNNLGYWIFFRGYDGDYLAIKPNDDVSFSVDRSGEEIMLTYAPETITQSLINDLVAECQATDDIIGIKNADFSLDKDGNLKTADITVWGFYQHFGKHEPPEDFWREISVEINANGAVTATDIPYGQDGYARLLSKYYPIEDKGGSMLTPQNFSDAVNSLKIDGIIVKENLSADGYRLLYRCAAELFDGFNIDNIERCHIVTKYSVGKAETPAGIADLYDNCFILVPYKGGNADLTNMVALIIEFLI
ncbi:MAG: hypothetical protein FWD23_17355, partial [Oscillospiraceae bacterium]|nr:hypothetical protein [Oscillospiraceae bacterium]